MGEQPPWDPYDPYEPREWQGQPPYPPQEPYGQQPYPRQSSYQVTPFGQPYQQLPGELPGQPQDRAPEVDAHGLPVQDRPAKGRAVLGAISWLITIACPILGAVSAGIAITYSVSHHKLAWHLVGLGTVAGLLATGLTGFGGPWWFRKGKKYKHDGAITSIVVVGGLLGMIGMFMLGGIPNP